MECLLSALLVTRNPTEKGVILTCYPSNHVYDVEVVFFVVLRDCSLCCYFSHEILCSFASRYFFSKVLVVVQRRSILL